VIFNDAVGQKEVYHDNEFSCFGNQPKIIGLAKQLYDHIRENALNYYNSAFFKRSFTLWATQ
jgi:hypothetical protein